MQKFPVSINNDEDIITPVAVPVYRYSIINDY